MFTKDYAYLLSQKPDLRLSNIPTIDMNKQFENTLFRNKQIDDLLNYNYEKYTYITKTALLSLLNRIKIEQFKDSDTLYFNSDFSITTKYFKTKFIFEVKKEFLF